MRIARTVFELIVDLALASLFRAIHHTYGVELADPTISAKASSLRFWYGASISEFVESNAEKIVGQLTLNSSFDIDRTQAAAWLAQIEFLRSQLKGRSGSVFFEFNIPRMGRRIDVVLVIGPVVFA